MKKIEFLLDVGSPTTYLAWTQLPAIAERHGATIEHVPVLLGAVHKGSGNTSPITVMAKGKHMMVDLARFAKRYGVPLQFNPHFPINTLPLMRGATALLGSDAFVPYMDAVFKAIWVDAKNMGDPSVIAEVIESAGINGQELLERIGQQEVKDQLRKATEDAVARGVFGAPTFFIGNDMFFGQDRLDFVDEALAG